MPFTNREYIIGAFGFVTAILIAVVLIFRYVWTGKSSIRASIINYSITVFTLFYLVCAGEVFFYFFVTPSSSFSFTLASRRWTDRFWSPVNSLGYRDIEHQESDFTGKKIVFAVGDSFAAGFGIKDYRDRFSNILQNKLGEDWLVINVAQNAWDTSSEYNGIISYPHKPDIIILSYYLNDIRGAAVQNGFVNPPHQVKYPALLSRYIRNSYLLNYLYWRIYVHLDKNLGKNYWKHFQKSYSNIKIWKTHKEELLNIVNYAKDNDIRLVSVLFPVLIEVERSRALLWMVGDVMRKNNVETIDLSAILKGRDSSELIVNSFDFHPSKQLHKEVGELLYDQIRRQ